MRQHQPGMVARGGRPQWLENAHSRARHNAWLAKTGQRPDRIETREEMRGGNIVSIIAESRVDIPVPAALKDRGVKEVFTKTNSAVELQGESITAEGFRSRTLVVVFKQPQNGIRGLPVSPAEGRKLRKQGFTHLVITSVPQGARQREGLDALMQGRYDESGWWLGFYKPTGGHRHEGQKGGELVCDFQSELFVLQYLCENGLWSLYEVPLIASWKFLPKTDEQREEENAAAEQIQALFGRVQRLHEEHTYHYARLFEHFRDMHRESAMDETELEARAQAALNDTVIGGLRQRRIEDGSYETRAYYLALDESMAYSIHNSRQGQMVVKIDLRTRTVEVGLVKQDLNGLALMGFYDDFLTSNKFREVTWSEFSTYTTGISAVDLAGSSSESLAINGS